MKTMYEKGKRGKIVTYLTERRKENNPENMRALIQQVERRNAGFTIEVFMPHTPTNTKYKKSAYDPTDKGFICMLNLYILKYGRKQMDKKILSLLGTTKEEAEKMLEIMKVENDKAEADYLGGEKNGI